MTNELVYELAAGEPDPAAGAALIVPHYMPGWESVRVDVRRVDVLLSLQPPAWWVYGLDQAGHGVRVYVHRQHPTRVEGRATWRDLLRAA